ncbi:MAG: hypothetical protein AAF681_04650 [Pseudomonadota bacterium]
MLLNYSTYIQHKRELVKDEVWDAYANALGRHVTAPGFAIARERIKVGYPKSFQKTVSDRFGTSVTA